MHFSWKTLAAALVLGDAVVARTINLHGGIQEAKSALISVGEAVAAHAPRGFLTELQERGTLINEEEDEVAEVRDVEESVAGANTAAKKNKTARAGKKNKTATV